jgi:hypothetical protein
MLLFDELVKSSLNAARGVLALTPPRNYVVHYLSFPLLAQTYLEPNCFFLPQHTLVQNYSAVTVLLLCFLEDRPAYKLFVPKVAVVG